MEPKVLITRLIKLAKDCVRSENGASMVEYGLLLTLVGIVCVTLITALSPSLIAMFNHVSLAF